MIIDQGQFFPLDVQLVHGGTVGGRLIIHTPGTRDRVLGKHGDSETPRPSGVEVKHGTVRIHIERLEHFRGGEVFSRTGDGIFLQTNNIRARLRDVLDNRIGRILRMVPITKRHDIIGQHLQHLLLQ